MSPELQRALNRHTQWFGSYKASGQLKKLLVWLVVTDGQIEFLTLGNSYKVKRMRSGAGIPKILEGPPAPHGDIDRTSNLDRDAAKQASGRSSPA